MRKLVTILIVTFAAISCGNIRDAHNILLDIETFINERPDSALVILNSFDASFLENRSVWAQHSLLHAQAKDKCYIDETDDSLMTQVVNYYENKRDKEKLFKAYYYLGRIQYNAGDYAESMLSYTKAEQVIDEVDDDFFKGLLYAQLGMLHQMYYDYAKSLNSYQLAYRCYENAEMITHLWYTKYNIAYVLLEMKSYCEAEEILSDVIIWAYDNNFDTLCREAIECLISLYNETENIEKSIAIISSQYGQLLAESVHVIRAEAYSLAIDGNTNAINIMKDKVWNHTHSQSDTIASYFYEARINQLLGNYKDALLVQEKLYCIQDSILMSSMKYPLLSVKNKFLQSEYDKAQLRINSHKIKLLLICTVIIVSIILISLIFRNRIITKNLVIARYVEIAEELETSLVTKRKEIEIMSKEISMADMELKESTSYISNILSKQYELLNKLTSTYYETHGCNKDKEAIYNYVSKEIERLSSDKQTIRQLEDIVNRHKGNIMTVIRTELPHFTEMEYRLLCYWCAGFSAKAISIFTGDSTNNIYVKKSRIKNEIQDLENDVKNAILSAINS